MNVLRQRYSKELLTGFTVVELLVVIGIMAIVTATTLINYPQFSRRLDTEREAQLVALALRDAEERAIRTHRAGGVFTAPFGVHFIENSDQYILFSDTGGDANFYNPGEELETISLGRGVRVNDICQFEKNPLLGTNCDITSLSVTFRRPAPFIEIHGVMGGFPQVDLGEPDFEIHVDNNGEYEKTIVIWTTGAISIEDSP